MNKAVPSLFLTTLITLTLCMSLGFVRAQSYVIIDGLVVNTNGDPLRNAHVLNLTKKIGTTSNSHGNFKIFASPGDSMMVSSMGYKAYKASVPKEMHYKVFSILIRLTEDTIYLKETIIRAFPPTYELFKKEFVSLKIERTPNEKLFAKIMDKQYNPKGGIVLKGPISAIYDAFSREGKLKRKLAHLIYQDNLREVVYDKVPKELLINAYKMKDEAELEMFLDFCQIPENMIVNGTPYELIVFMNQSYLKYPKKTLK